jgi:hypothetical protein
MTRRNDLLHVPRPSRHRCGVGRAKVRSGVAFAALIFAGGTALATAAPTPTPAPAPTLNAEEFNKRLRESLQKHVLPTPMVPTQTLRVVLVVETNKKGQVTRVR